MTNGDKTPPPVSGEENGNPGSPDDFDFEGPFGDDGGLKPQPTLGDMWRESGPFKAGVIGGAIALLIIWFVLFGGSTPDVGPAGAPPASNVEQTVGTGGPLTEEMQSRLVEQERQRVEAALAGAGSVVPNPPGAPPVGLGLGEDTGPETDPLQRWRDLQSRAQQTEPVGSAQQVPTSVAAAQPEASLAIGAMSGAMSDQMTSILGSRTVPEVRVLQINSKSWLESRREAQAAAEAQAAEAAAQAAQAGAQVAAPQKILVPAGEIEYAQMLTEANSDIPGPVLAQVASGPLKGARLIGQFQVKSDKFLAITFQTAVIDGVATQIDAVALDPDTTLPGMVTDIDHRYLRRIILPSAAAFVEGFAQAVADSGRTTVTVDGSTVIEESNSTTNTQEVNAGIAEAGQEVGDILSDIANDTEVMVKVHAGTPMGVLFLAPVVERDNNAPFLDRSRGGNQEDTVLRLLEGRDTAQGGQRRNAQREQERFIEDLLGPGAT
ncbi:MAG TPA: hypothetical protein DDX54_03780 [Rhodospirillaceae bacterium]|jgi:intracellular multiplication protein IcmE|nr:DotG/IcmE/VirB10 family protein [Alphaproteobacteria bacterium]HBH26503.1 hypothetical protein [Rhodospirillaceae bacterium]